MNMNLKMKVALTPGVALLLEKYENKFHLEHLNVMVKTAIKLIDRHEFIVFHHEKVETVVTDRKSNILASLSLWIPENICVMPDDTDDEYAFIVLLESEYTRMF